MEVLADIIILKQGDSLQREDFLKEHQPYVRKVVNNFCKKFCDWGQDDELSIALIAFNSAIDTYTPDRQVPFLAFAKIVIENRLRDYFRKEGRVRANTTRLEVCVDENEWISPGEIKQSLETYWAKSIEEERQEELERFAQLLEKYEIDFDELPEFSPCHKATRQSLMTAAVSLAQNPTFLGYFKAKKQLPLKELALATSISRKTLEKGRKYIIVLVLILTNPMDFIYLKSFINFPAGRSDNCVR